MYVNTTSIGICAETFVSEAVVICLYTISVIIRRYFPRGRFYLCYNSIIYSRVPNNRAYTLIIFGKIFQPTCPYSGLHEGLTRKNIDY